MAAILMIDDEQAILELVKNGLQKDGHFVTAYTSAAQVPLDKLNRYDLIILDIMMPDIDGFSYCDKIRSLVDYPVRLQRQWNMTSHLGLVWEQTTI